MTPRDGFPRTFNPLKHVDRFGTILLPALLLLVKSPFLFGYAKPVPVNFSRLNNPRRDMVWVAAAGPATNMALATVSALLLHLIVLLPAPVAGWIGENLSNSVVINVLLAVFNMLPLPAHERARVRPLYRFRLGDPGAPRHHPARGGAWLCGA